VKFEVRELYKKKNVKSIAKAKKKPILETKKSPWIYWPCLPRARILLCLDLGFRV